MKRGARDSSAANDIVSRAKAPQLQRDVRRRRDIVREPGRHRGPRDLAERAGHATRRTRRSTPSHAVVGAKGHPPRNSRGSTVEGRPPTAGSVRGVPRSLLDLVASARVEQVYGPVALIAVVRPPVDPQPGSRRGPSGTAPDMTHDIGSKLCVSRSLDSGVRCPSDNRAPLSPSRTRDWHRCQSSWRAEGPHDGVFDVLAGSVGEGPATEVQEGRRQRVRDLAHGDAALQTLQRVLQSLESPCPVGVGRQARVVRKRVEAVGREGLVAARVEVP